MSSAIQDCWFILENAVGSKNTAEKLENPKWKSLGFPSLVDDEMTVALQLTYQPDLTDQCARYLNRGMMDKKRTVWNGSIGTIHKCW